MHLKLVQIVESFVPVFVGGWSIKFLKTFQNFYALSVTDGGEASFHMIGNFGTQKQSKCFIGNGINFSG